MARAAHTPAVLRVDILWRPRDSTHSPPLHNTLLSPAPHQVHPVTSPTPPPPTPAPPCSANHRWPSECYSVTISSLATL